MHDILLILAHILTLAFLLFGLFFMFVGALGLVKLPDLYNRIHAASKCITLGISGLLLAAAIGLSLTPDAQPLHIITKAGLVILFQFIASPVSAHLLAKAAHLDRAPKYPDTITDELEEDRALVS
jgi:multicomponent Na+:H+ antiporter subunit G